MSAPKIWKRLNDGQVVTMETPQTKRAAELKQLHKTINMFNMETDERLDALLVLKAIVQVGSVILLVIIIITFNKHMNYVKF